MNRPARDPDQLRRSAELRLKQKQTSEHPPAEADLRRMQHELQVHQIELEIQNEELCAARAELEANLKRYQDLFDAAPVSYFTLNAEGVVVDLNLTAAKLVGLEQGRLRGRKFGSLLAETDRLAFTRILADVFSGGTKLSADLTMTHEHGKTTFVHLEASLSSDAKSCRVVLIDLTERKRAEDKLRLSDLALKAISQGVAIIDIDHKIQWVNQSFESITGYSSVETLGTDGSFVRGVLTDSNTINAVLEAVSKGTEFAGDILNYHKNGTPFWNDLSISPIRNERGELTHLIAVFRDITARKQSEAEKRRIEERFKFAMKASNIGFWDWNIQANTIEYSHEWKRLLGYGENEFGNAYSEWESRVHPDDLPFIYTHRQKYLTGQIPLFEIEYRLRHKDGTWRWFYARGELLHNDLVDPTEMLGCLIDITERKRAVDALQLMKFCVDHAADSVFWISPEGRVLYVNDAGCRERGYSREELLGMSVSDFAVGKEYQPDFWAKHFDDLRRRGAVTLESRHRAKDGRVFPVEIHANYVRIGNQELNYVSVRDITERKGAEDELRKLQAQISQTQKLESLGVLAGGIAHDFNNLLTAMLGHASLARLELPADSPIASYLGEIELAARNAANLTNQMLTYSGQGQFVNQPIRLDVVVQEMLQLLSTVVSKKVQIAPTLELAPIEGDPTQTRQIIMNLIINASDSFGGEPGVIRVRTGIRQMDSASLQSPYIPKRLNAGRYSFVEVADDGCGMNEETLQKIFDPFFSTKMAGRGLGLAAVLGIIRGHHGTIKVTSTPGRGSTFEVFFPATEAQAKPDSDGSDQGLSLGKGTVLVIEDEDFIRRLLQKCLAKAGFCVLSAADGIEGLAVFDQHSTSVSAILLDLTMPRMDGLEVLKELRSRSANVPILVMSGYSEQGRFQQNSNLASCEFIQKPFMPTDLLARVCELVRPKSTESKNVP